MHSAWLRRKLALGWAAMALSAAWAAEVEPTQVRVTDVAVFKHGYGFVLTEGVAKTSDGWITFAETPQASLGTLWLYSPQPGVSVDRVTAEVQEVKQARRAESLEGLVQANLGATVTVRGQGNGQVWRGTLQEPIMGADPNYYSRQPAPVSADDAGIWAAVPPRPDAPPPTLAFLVVRTRDGDQFIPRNLVRDLTIHGEASREAQVAKPKQVLRARLVQGNQTFSGEATIGLAYLAKGLRWMPAYRLQILPENRLLMQLQGTIINDVADLDGSKLHLVVGVPNFIQQDVLSPLSLQVAWTRLSSYFAEAQMDPRRRDMLSNAMMTQVAMPGMMGGGMGGSMEAEPTTPVMPITGEAVDELFFYEVPDVTLKRGARAAVAIFEDTLPYEDVYLWKELDDRDYWRRWSSSYNPPRGTGSPDTDALAEEAKKAKVWHALRVTNTTKQPWTTAPAMAVRDWQPISQTMLLYTPVGGEVDITTTMAPDILTERIEEETDRQRQALRVSGTDYDLVTVRGEVTVTNHKATAVRLIATRELRGSVQEITEEGKAVKLGDAPARLDPMTRLSWDVRLASGETRKLTYIYTIYAPI